MGERGEPTTEAPIRVAIVGGGCAGMAAAFELTQPALRGRYAVTVYQLGWRLGGKGASGRGPADRIEEHGLHLWMGFYENAFRLMRSCYAELARDPAQCRLATVEDAFKPAPHVGVTDRRRSGEWTVWSALFPVTGEMPGAGHGMDGPLTVRLYLRRAAELLVTLLQAARGGGAAPGGRALPLAELTVVGGLYKSCVALVGLLRDGVGAGRVATTIEGVAAACRARLAAIVEHDDELRHLWEVADIILAILLGAVRCGLLTDPRGFSAIDDHDWRGWLAAHGATDASLDSGFMRGIYDLAFAYEDGDVARPRLAAGVALRGAMRMFFTYRGSLFWTMQAGMGDVVFAPLYEVLARRGVRFEFFHRLQRVGLVDEARVAAGESPHVTELEFAVQARTLAGADYRPLVDVRGLPCWPARPDWSQLVDGERMAAEGVDLEAHWEDRRIATRRLRVGEDFDLVVLAVGIGEVPHVCAEILERDARWRSMVAAVKTVATQAMQLWLSTDARGLGWSAPPINVSGFVEPFDTWADLSHLASEESWPVAPGSIAYFCSVLADGPRPDRPDAAEAARQRTLVEAGARRFLERDMPALWPGAYGPGGFAWDLLVLPPDAKEARGAARLAGQYLRANINPTDRYVLSLPGSTRHRISPLDRTYDNLTIAGDWTASGLDSGCVESAVMSGMLAAHALSGSPSLAMIVGYDHP